MKYDLIIIYAGTGIPDGDLSPRVTGMRKKCPPQAFVGIPAGKFFRHGDGDGEPKPDGEFPVAISSARLRLKREVNVRCAPRWGAGAVSCLALVAPPPPPSTGERTG
jgi:hypothetical protein